MFSELIVGRRSQYLLLVAIIFTGALLYFYSIQEEHIQKSHLTLFTVNDNRPPQGFLVHTPGCRIPEMNPFDSSILKYLSPAATVTCSLKPILIESDQNSIRIVKNALKSYNVSNIADIDCCYKHFEREAVNPEKINKNIDDSIRMTEECIPFEESAKIYKEFIEVTCTLFNKTIYQDYHAFIVPKKSSSDFNRKPDELSVLIIGADALSRMNFLRQMPKTKDFINSLGAVHFLGYNKVQDNTFPNLVPVLSGLSVEEIRKLCWFKDSEFFDECPWIWKNFSSQNYVTAFGEDSCNIGLFNYLKNGFLYQPTDYYIRPYVYTNERRIGRMKPMNTKYCVGGRFTAEVLLDYAYKFSVNMTSSNKKFWGFFWETSLTHDFLNVPANNDNIFFTFFKRIVQENILNSTAIVFLSDHGMRWGSIRETYQGRMEEHLPFLNLIFPKWFKEKYKSAMKNLQQNVHLLTTHFDLHETLKDLMNLSSLEESNLSLRVPQTRDLRGISLFLPIPVNRTCGSAGIQRTWCTCQQSKQISVSDNMVKKAAETVLVHLNQMLSKYKQCAKLQLERISSARVEDTDKLVQEKTKSKVSDYIIHIETKPGLAKFEATVRHRSDWQNMKVLGGVSRINVYGSQSKCIDNYRLKLYCFCT